METTTELQKEAAEAFHKVDEIKAAVELAFIKLPSGTKIQVDVPGFTPSEIALIAKSNGQSPFLPTVSVPFHWTRIYLHDSNVAIRLESPRMKAEVSFSDER